MSLNNEYARICPEKTNEVVWLHAQARRTAASTTCHALLTLLRQHLKARLVASAGASHYSVCLHMSLHTQFLCIERMPAYV